MCFMPAEAIEVSGHMYQIVHPAGQFTSVPHTSDPHQCRSFSGVTGKSGDACLNQDITNMAKATVKGMRIIFSHQYHDK